jgi:hypothetical protein
MRMTHKERERESVCEQERQRLKVFMCVCARVCVCVRERERGEEARSHYPNAKVVCFLRLMRAGKGGRCYISGQNYKDFYSRN